jgi:hypothetical protein
VIYKEKSRRKDMKKYNFNKEEMSFLTQTTIRFGFMLPSVELVEYSETSGTLNFTLIGNSRKYNYCCAYGDKQKEATTTAFAYVLCCVAGYCGFLNETRDRMYVRIHLEYEDWKKKHIKGTDPKFERAMKYILSSTEKDTYAFMDCEELNCALEYDGSVCEFLANDHCAYNHENFEDAIVSLLIESGRKKLREKMKEPSPISKKRS